MIREQNTSDTHLPTLHPTQGHSACVYMTHDTQSNYNWTTEAHVNTLSIGALLVRLRYPDKVKLVEIVFPRCAYTLFGFKLKRMCMYVRVLLQLRRKSSSTREDPPHYIMCVTPKAVLLCTFLLLTTSAISLSLLVM